MRSSGTLRDCQRIMQIDQDWLQKHTVSALFPASQEHVYRDHLSQPVKDY